MANREKSEVKEEPIEKSEVQDEDLVEIELFKDNGEYKDDFTVGINGKMYKIKRGVKVKVPKAVHEVIIRSVEADKKTASLIESLTKKYEEMKN